MGRAEAALLCTILHFSAMYRDKFDRQFGKQDACATYVRAVAEEPRSFH
jgi:hypothetical protein